ncbi:neuropeptide-like 3 isoform X2 [Vespa velutina]|uniref:neuropeptide-like 3 isoform X2 n=1 Tax=Vespa velutina TaxID=202808 RepID=UPI001FB413D0|nr:neuropeptide-like 3 isoform X2 [Vespa velutina]
MFKHLILIALIGLAWSAPAPAPKPAPAPAPKPLSLITDIKTPASTAKLTPLVAPIATPLISSISRVALLPQKSFEIGKATIYCPIEFQAG